MYTIYNLIYINLNAFKEKENIFIISLDFLYMTR